MRDPNCRTRTLLHALIEKSASATCPEYITDLCLNILGGYCAAGGVSGELIKQHP